MLQTVLLLAVFLIGFFNDVNSMAISKRSDKTENSLERPDQTEYPEKVDYDVYPVRRIWF